MDCKWHPTQPWIFTCGNDGIIKFGFDKRYKDL